MGTKQEGGREGEGFVGFERKLKINSRQSVFFLAGQSCRFTSLSNVRAFMVW